MAAHRSPRSPRPCARPAGQDCAGQTALGQPLPDPGCDSQHHLPARVLHTADQCAGLIAGNHPRSRPVMPRFTAKPRLVTPPRSGSFTMMDQCAVSKGKDPSRGAFNALRSSNTGPWRAQNPRVSRRQPPTHQLRAEPCSANLTGRSLARLFDGRHRSAPRANARLTAVGFASTTTPARSLAVFAFFDMHSAPTRMGSSSRSRGNGVAFAVAVVPASVFRASVTSVLSIKRRLRRKHGRGRLARGFRIHSRYGGHADNSPSGMRRV